ncbi:MAG TPA: ABC transporter permease subunit [Gaiellaceae bacterium]
MAWVTWRQHRSQLVGALGLLVALAAAALSTRIPIQAAFDRESLSGCLPPATRTGCDIIVPHFESQFGGLVTALRSLAVLPVLAGLFVGAPLVARELEQGTYRFAWTQGVTRRRWLLSKTALLAAGTVLAAAAVSALVMWWRGPYDALEGRIGPNSFDIEGLVVPAYALFALALGVLAGLVFRRSVAAMTATLLAFGATRFLVLEFVRPHFLTPLHRAVVASDTGRQAGDWVLSNTLVDGGGRQISAAREELAVVHAQLAGIDPHTYIVTLGWQRLITYQPAGRFWTFQLLEAGIFVGLAALVVVLTLWLVRRTPS